MKPFAVVAVEDPHVRPDQTHHYRVPADVAEPLRPGCLVIAPFGTRLRRGWVVGDDDASPVAETKPLVAALPEAPGPSAAQVALARWLSRRAHVGLARALALALPTPLFDAALPRLRAAPDRPVEPPPGGAAGAALLARLQKKPLRLDLAWSGLPATAAGLLAELERLGYGERLPPVGPRRAPAEAPAVDLPASPAPDRATREMCGAVFADMTNRRGGVFVITSADWPEAALEQLVRHAAANRRQVLLLVPRPGQPPAPLAVLLARFPGALLLRRPEDAASVAQARPPLVVGGRLAPFVPFADLGLVVVLDEHDPAYGGERPPFVHGREVALQAARFARATTVLVSPTPDPATLWRAQRAGVRRFALRGPAPVHVRVVDLRQELRAGRGGLLSEPLREALAATLRSREQAVLLLNRRGSAAILVCRHCGASVCCSRCTANLVYHADDQALHCHVCDVRQGRPAACPNCRAPRLDELAAGVQRLVREVELAFPEGRVGRWDSDSAPGIAARRALVRRFVARELDVLVGTQPVALADDLPPVPCAAAALADIGLRLPDHRAAERTYELLAALRRRVAPGGTLVVQTYLPDHWAIRAIAAGDPALFYGEELQRRQELGYPPFRQLARLTCRATSRERCVAEVRRVRDVLAAKLASEQPGLTDALLGPAPAYVEQVRGVYRWQLHLRAPNVQPLLAVVPPHWTVEVDPEDLR